MILDRLHTEGLRVIYECANKDISLVGGIGELVSKQQSMLKLFLDFYNYIITILLRQKALRALKLSMLFVLLKLILLGSSGQKSDKNLLR